MAREEYMGELDFATAKVAARNAGPCRRVNGLAIVKRAKASLEWYNFTIRQNKE